MEDSKNENWLCKSFIGIIPGFRDFIDPIWSESPQIALSFRQTETS